MTYATAKQIINAPAPVRTEYEEFTWMKVVTDIHTEKKYYSIGQVKPLAHTLAVTECGGLGGRLFYCQQHQLAYSAREHCAECQNAVVDAADDASVASCYTPEIER